MTLPRVRGDTGVASMAVGLPGAYVRGRARDKGGRRMYPATRSSDSVLPARTMIEVSAEKPPWWSPVEFRPASSALTAVRHTRAASTAVVNSSASAERSRLSGRWRRRPSRSLSARETRQCRCGWLFKEFPHRSSDLVTAS